MCIRDRPYLVSDILAPDGTVLEHRDPVCKQQVIQPETSAVMREMMEAVVLYLSLIHISG